MSISCRNMHNLLISGDSQVCDLGIPRFLTLTISSFSCCCKLSNSDAQTTAHSVVSKYSETGGQVQTKLRSPKA